MQYNMLLYYITLYHITACIDPRTAEIHHVRTLLLAGVVNKSCTLHLLDGRLVD